MRKNGPKIELHQLTLKARTITLNGFGSKLKKGLKRHVFTSLEDLQEKTKFGLNI